mgnify:CR=1 FL=1
MDLYGIYAGISEVTEEINDRITVCNALIVWGMWGDDYETGGISIVVAVNSMDSCNLQRRMEAAGWQAPSK